MNTLLLDTATWDLTVDASGNIAVASGAYAVAQDVASACRLFLGELWYDTTKGVPYLQQILAQRPPAAFIKAKLIEAALTVPGIISAQVFFTSFVDRALAGQVQVKTASGATAVAGFGQLQGDVPWYVSAVNVEAAA